MSSIKDKTQIEFNPFNADQPFDLVKTFNENRIVTAELSASGYLAYAFDVASNSYIAIGPSIVTDDNGNVVVI